MNALKKKKLESKRKNELKYSTTWSSLDKNSYNLVSNTNNTMNTETNKTTKEKKNFEILVCIIFKSNYVSR